MRPVFVLSRAYLSAVPSPTGANGHWTTFVGHAGKVGFEPFSDIRTASTGRSPNPLLKNRSLDAGCGT